MADQVTTTQNGWIRTTLGEVADIIMGQSPVGESYNQIGDGLPFYQGVTEFNDKYVGIKSFTNQPTKIIEQNTILFSVRAPVGRVNFTKYRACIGRGNAGLLMKNKEQDFLYFLLKNNERKFLNNTTGTVFDSISGVELRNFEITLPESELEQRAIAAVLSSLDDKIELLREQNKTLEATAQAIFKEWFVNFNFPGANRKMIDSELGKIPEGWRVGKLGNEVETVLGGTPSTKKKEYWKDGTIPWINSGKVNDFRICEPTSYITEIALNESAAKLMPKGTVVIAITGATLGQISRLEINSTSNQSVIGIIPNEKFSSVYLFYWMLENVSTIINTATGGAQQHINKNDVNSFDFIVPTSDILKKYYEAVNPMMDKISGNCFQIQTLSTLRDTLLPKLMKGEIRVKGFKD